jgi:hypothetical protein
MLDTVLIPSWKAPSYCSGEELAIWHWDLGKYANYYHTRQSNLALIECIFYLTMLLRGALWFQEGGLSYSQSLPPRLVPAELPP